MSELIEAGAVITSTSIDVWGEAPPIGYGERDLVVIARHENTVGILTNDPKFSTTVTWENLTTGDVFDVTYRPISQVLVDWEVIR